jgi:hypothetical protein
MTNVTNKGALLLAFFWFILLMPGSAAGQEVIAWERMCSSGTYQVVMAEPPSVLIQCLEAEEPPPTVDNNQLLNSTFEGVHNSTTIPSWNNVGGSGGLYVISRANTTKNKTTTGYAVKWGPTATHGEGYPGVSGMIEQVVPSRGRNLTAKIAVIQCRATTANYNVYGRQAGGNWVLVWQPVDISDVSGGCTTWNYSEVTITVSQDFDEYLIQLESRWDADNSPGVKWGDAWFGSE